MPWYFDVTQMARATPIRVGPYETDLDAHVAKDAYVESPQFGDDVTSAPYESTTQWPSPCAIARIGDDDAQVWTDGSTGPK